MPLPVVCVCVCACLIITLVTFLTIGLIESEELLTSETNCSVRITLVKEADKAMLSSYKLVEL